MGIKKTVTKKEFEKALNMLQSIKNSREAIKRNNRNLQEMAKKIAKKMGYATTLNIIGETPEEWFSFINYAYEYIPRK